MAAEDLKLFLSRLAAAAGSKAPPREKYKAVYKKKGPGTAVPKVPVKILTPLERQDSTRWTHQAIVYLATTTHCSCGEKVTQTNPIPLVRRCHPIYGIHEEALEIAHKSPTLHTLPVIVEDRIIDIDNCHVCLMAIKEEEHQLELPTVPGHNSDWTWYSPANQFCMELQEMVQ